jgi:iron complex transport system substrate-binding protein
MISLVTLLFTAPVSGAGRSVTDAAGRVVALPETVERIGCLYSFSGHAVALLGLGPKIVAVSKGLKRDSLLLEICPAIEEALVPKSQGGLNIEELLKARPDIVFLSPDVGKDAGETDKLEAFGIPYLVVDYATIVQQQQAVHMIGQALDRSEEAAAYIRYYNDCIQRVRNRLSSLPETEIPRVYHAVNEATRTAIPRSLSTGWLDVLGVVNVVETETPGAMEGKQTVSLEQILLWDPDVILVNEPATRKQILADRPFAPLRAVRQKRVYLLPIALSRWGHPGSIETPLAILWASKTLYPQHFETLDIAAETRLFYERFFNHRLSDEKVGQILDGRLERKPKNPNGGNRR